MMRTKVIFSLAVFVAMLATPLTLQADTVLGNTFTGGTDGGVNPFDAGQTVDPGVTSPGVFRPGHTLNGGFDALVAGELRTFGDNIDTGNRYFGFTINPNSGAEISFDNFVYNGFSTLNAGTVEPTKFGFRSSLDSFSNNIGTALATGTTIDLTGAEFQNVTGPIEFRLYNQIATDFSDDGSSSGTTYSLSDFVFNGTVVAVPEPSSFALIALAGLATCSRRRRKS